MATFIDKAAPAKDLVERIYEPIEQGLDSIGLMQGQSAPARRLVFGFALGSALTYIVRPSSMYNPDGSPRSWSVLDPEAADKSPVAWWMPGAALGGFMGLFV